MSEEYILKWEQIVSNRVVKKTKTFLTEEKLNQFRKEVMQRKQFFALLSTKSNFRK